MDNPDYFYDDANTELVAANDRIDALSKRLKKSEMESSYWFNQCMFLAHCIDSLPGSYIVGEHGAEAVTVPTEDEFKKWWTGPRNEALNCFREELDE